MHFMYSSVYIGLFFDWPARLPLSTEQSFKIRRICAMFQSSPRSQSRLAGLASNHSLSFLCRFDTPE